MNNIEIFKQIQKAPFEKGFMPSGEAVLDRRHQKIIEHTSKWGHILEVGPGNGKLGVYFISQGRPYSIVDVSRKDLFHFYEYIGNESKTPSFIFNELWEWKMLPDDCFETVIAAEVIEHVSNYSGLIHEMMRVSRGNVILTTPVGKSFYCDEHVHFFSEEDFEFIDKPYTIERIITKEADIASGNQCFFIEINTRND